MVGSIYCDGNHLWKSDEAHAGVLEKPSAFPPSQQEARAAHCAISLAHSAEINPTAMHSAAARRSPRGLLYRGTPARHRVTIKRPLTVRCVSRWCLALAEEYATVGYKLSP
ncbi:hypothetical protein SKAU_G00031080 [Synaphobranchus kaupii]|uniref:Uncharacterized protein n=1 Tax=Synaphobranchus kaupii TaxID=118154 RepID=A0A9Q1GEZ8_SYNKA|nr:hypothetical protein SKAU_G00031080 [Synaphobranchus kaupii]